MEISCIFEIVEESLYSVKYSDEDDVEFVKIFENWTNAAFLYDFFTIHAIDLARPIWEGVTIEEAVIRTRNEAISFEEKLIRVAESGKTTVFEGLSSFFSPLVNGRYEPYHEKDKAKGVERKSWLRIYAIREDVNLFLVSGGAIKLTRTMNERDHLERELYKLDLAKSFIKVNGDDLYNYCEVN